MLLHKSVFIDYNTFCAISQCEWKLNERATVLAENVESPRSLSLQISWFEGWSKTPVFTGHASLATLSLIVFRS